MVSDVGVLMVLTTYVNINGYISAQILFDNFAAIKMRGKFLFSF